MRIQLSRFGNEVWLTKQVACGRKTVNVLNIISSCAYDVPL